MDRQARTLYLSTGSTSVELCERNIYVCTVERDAARRQEPEANHYNKIENINATVLYCAMSVASSVLLKSFHMDIAGFFHRTLFYYFSI
jgi:hypothetical protein